MCAKMPMAQFQLLWHQFKNKAGGRGRGEGRGKHSNVFSFCPFLSFAFFKTIFVQMYRMTTSRNTESCNSSLSKAACLGEGGDVINYNINCYTPLGCAGTPNRGGS